MGSLTLFMIRPDNGRLACRRCFFLIWGSFIFSCFAVLHGLCVEDEEEIIGLRNAEKEQGERTKNLGTRLLNLFFLLF